MKTAKWFLAGLALVLLTGCVFREDAGRYGYDHGGYHDHDDHWR